jgi:c-di-GMP-binding flagellar brake protein YcgR
MGIPEDKRRFIRLNALVDVVYHKISPQEKEKISLTKNISKGGICLIAYEELKKSDMLDLKIFLPEDKKPIHAIGKIVWSKSFIIGDISSGKRFDLGIEFIDITEEEANKINKYVFTQKL